MMFYLIEAVGEFLGCFFQGIGVDVIICISHLGWNIDGTDDTEVIAASRHIDLVLGGHSHSLFQKLKYRTDLDGKQVPVDQNGKGAIWVGKMTLDIVKNK